MRWTSSQGIGSGVMPPGYKASGLGDKALEAGEYLSNKYTI